MFHYIYIYIHKLNSNSKLLNSVLPGRERVGRGDDSVGNPRRAQISQLELFELITLLNLDKQFSIEQFEPQYSISVYSTLPPHKRESGTATNS